MVQKWNTGTLYFILIFFTCASLQQDPEKLIHRGAFEGCSVEGGGVVSHGDQWWSEDRCTECHCKNGELECQNAHCASCINPHYLPGHCCPQCHESDIHLSHCTWIDGCSLRCKHGRKRDDDGCFRCECLKIEGEDCSLQCVRYSVDSLGRSICECNTTESTLEQHSCKDEGGLKRVHGEEWSDGCRQCACSNGAVLCTLLACPRCPSGSTLSLQPGQCCPQCGEGVVTDVCEWGDLRWSSGSRWLQSGCVRCECRRGGQLLCGADEACPPAPCSSPSMADCGCPKCGHDELLAPSSVGGGCSAGARTEGDTWRRDVCTSCVCRGGQEVCFQERCSATCSMPVTVTGRCCPVCLNEGNNFCSEGNVTRAIGDTWRRGACMQCTCRDGGRAVCNDVCTSEQEAAAAAPPACCSACDADGGVHSDSHVVYQVAVIALSSILLLVMIGVVYWWYRRRGGLRLSGEHAWCCAAASKVRACRTPTVLTYNPVRLCSDTDQPPQEQRTSFIKV